MEPEKGCLSRAFAWCRFSNSCTQAMSVQGQRTKPAFPGWPPLGAQARDGLAKLASLKRRSQSDRVSGRANSSPSAQECCVSGHRGASLPWVGLERMTTERFMRAPDRAAAASGRSAAGCRRTGFSEWRPPPPGTRPCQLLSTEPVCFRIGRSFTRGGSSA